MQHQRLLQANASLPAAAVHSSGYWMYDQRAENVLYKPMNRVFSPAGPVGLCLHCCVSKDAGAGVYVHQTDDRPAAGGTA